MKTNIIVMRDSKAFYFDFDWSKNYDESNESLAEKKKGETEQLLIKYKHENNIHKREKNKNQ